MSTVITATTIRTLELPMGAALTEGRAPSHDGEYLSIYFLSSDPSEWICESNGGVTATSHFTHLDNATGSSDDLDAAEALDTRIKDALAAGGEGSPLQDCGNEARKLMSEMGWAA